MLLMCIVDMGLAPDNSSISSLHLHITEQLVRMEVNEHDRLSSNTIKHTLSRAKALSLLFYFSLTV